MKLRITLALLAAAILLQTTIVPYLAIQWFRPDLPLLVLIYIAVRTGAFEGVIVGFVAGVIIDSLSPGFFGLSSLSYCIACFTVGRLFFFDLPLPLPRWALASATGILLHGLMFSFFLSLHTAPSLLDMLITHVLPISFYTWALGMVWAISPLYEKRGRIKL